MNNKPPWASKTMWGAVFLLAAMIANQFGAEITPDEQAALTDKIVAGVEAGGAVLGIIMVFWGRLTAKTRISLKKA